MRDYIFGILTLLLLILVCWYFFCYTETKLNYQENFNNVSECSSVLPETTAMSLIYTNPNYVFDNIQLSNGQIFRGSLSEAETNNLGLYTTIKNDSINFYANKGPIQMSPNYGNSSVEILPSGYINAPNGIFANKICFGTPTSSECLTFSNGNLVGNNLSFQNLTVTGSTTVSKAMPVINLSVSETTNGNSFIGQNIDVPTTYVSNFTVN